MLRLPPNLPHLHSFVNIHANPNFILIKLTKEGEFLVALNPLTYVRQSYEELQKVVWPTRMETLRLSLVVAVGSILVGAYVAGLDYLFTKVTELFVK
ncbi:preprotein translocase subunit SecE [Candidatus Curtissbacteria bacterium]|nr:preprotein translocase subunit SecE [Candidatus Curtissbacteria bacterium]